MAETKVKICGITRPDDAVVAAEAGAWAIGMIFAPESPRRLDLETAGRIAAALPAGVLKVGVFANQSLEEIRLAEQAAGLDLFQLHGAETELFCRTLGAGRCLQAVFLEGEEGVEEAVSRPAEFVLLDRRRSAGVARGSGVDWGFAAKVVRRRPKTILAGGLNPKNVMDAVRHVQPWGVDVSSGVERAPGIKDSAKIKAFIEAIHEIR